MTRLDDQNPIYFLIDRLRQTPDNIAIYWRGQATTSGELAELVDRARDQLLESNVKAGDVVILKADYSRHSSALLLALIAHKTILIPMLPGTIERYPDLIDLADPSFIVDVSTADEVSISARGPNAEPHALFVELRHRNAPGLVLFTSGSTGQPKGVVHDFTHLLQKFIKRRPAMVTLNFLQFDHWGGLNTLLHCLSNLSPVVFPERRTSEHICELVERHSVELLPATPTFLNMLLISHAFEGHDLSSLELVSYGAEPMPESTLRNFRKAMPEVELRQTYGLIELGVLRAKSQSSDSLWVKIGGDGYDVRVVDDMLQIKAQAAMLGYLNAPSPFTDDGYFMTGDRVESKDGYYRILGRDSELINVGGEKVYPAEVEAVVLECDIVDDVVVYGEANAITGKIVCADVRLAGDSDVKTARREIKAYCRGRMDGFKIPVRINVVTGELHSDRFKRIRVKR